MSVLVDEQSRTEMLNRLKRAEGQLRGIQRMIESGQPGIDIASQLVAVRRALDSTYVHMTVSLVEKELGKSLRQKSFASTRWSTKEEAGWLVGVGKSRSLESDGIGDGVDSFLLANDYLAQDSLHIEELVFLSGL